MLSAISASSPSSMQRTRPGGMAPNQKRSKGYQPMFWYRRELSLHDDNVSDIKLASTESFVKQTRHGCHLTRTIIALCEVPYTCPLIETAM